MFPRRTVAVAWICVSASHGGWFGVSVNPGGLHGVQMPDILSPSLARTDHEATTLHYPYDTFLILTILVTLIASLLPGGHARAQQALTATPTATRPVIPGNFAGKVTDNGIVLSWTAPAGGADNYIIYRSWPHSSRDGTYVRYNVPGSSTSYTDSDVAVPGGHYNYHIRAFRGGWGSAYSDFLTVVVPESATPTATGTSTPTPANRGRGLSGDGAPELTATPTPASTLSVPKLTAQAGADAVELRWTEVSGAVRYELMVWWDAGTGWQPVGGANLTGTSYTHTGVTAGTTYYYTIRAVNAGGGTSAWLLQYATAVPSR